MQEIVIDSIKTVFAIMAFTSFMLFCASGLEEWKIALKIEVKR